MVTMFISSGCWNKWPQTGWFITVYIYSLIVLEGWSLIWVSLGWNQGVSRATLHLEAPRENHFLGFSSFCALSSWLSSWPWITLPFLRLLPLSHDFFLLCLQISLCLQFIIFILLILFLCNLSLQCGAWTQDPRVKSHKLYWLSCQGTPYTGDYI